MKEKPILFSAEMVRAILDGRKTQTRRVSTYQRFLWTENGIAAQDGDSPVACPYGKVGDHLWVRETWSSYINAITLEVGYVYKASHGLLPGQKWKPSIHMPRKASRITLEITNVRVEHLQDISEQDAIAEGIINEVYVQGEPLSSCWWNYQNKIYGSALDSPIDSFRSLWNLINATKHPWESNPWVWVIEFKRVNDDEQ